MIQSKINLALILMLAYCTHIVSATGEQPSLVRRSLHGGEKPSLVKRALKSTLHKDKKENDHIVLCYKAFNDLERLSRTNKIGQENYLIIKEEIFKDKSFDMTKMSEAERLEKKMSPATNSDSW